MHESAFAELLLKVNNASKTEINIRNQTDQLKKNVLGKIDQLNLDQDHLKQELIEIQNLLLYLLVREII